MKNLVKKLPLAGFILAIGAAFAFDGIKADPDPDATLFGLDENDQWVEASATSYICDTHLTRTCVAQFEDDDPSQPMTYEEKGIYNP